jgi:membrane carboxypeptidase/penicillin-binding protein
MRVMKRLLILLGKSVLALLSVAGVLLLVLEGWLIWHFEHGIGVPTESQIAALPASGHLCPTIPGTPYVPLAEIPPLLRKTVLVLKDHDFYERPHVSPLVQLVFSGDRRQPWSAITSSVGHHCLQVLAPTCCKGQPNLDWQIGHYVLMARIDRALTRDRILDAYLNDAYLGRRAYGVAAAAKAYFSKNLEALDIDEIALLVAHFRTPGEAPDRAKVERDFIIDKMHAAGLIDEQQNATAKAAPLPWLDKQPRDL